MKLRPLDDRVVIEPLEEEETTAGGIVLPDTAKEKPTRGRVVAAGAGKCLEDGTRAEMTLKVGDEVIFGKYSGTEITVGDTDYTIMRAGDVLARVVKEGAAKGKAKAKRIKRKKK